MGRELTLFLFNSFPIKTYSFNEVRHSLNGFSTERSLESRQLETGLNIIVKCEVQRVQFFDLLLRLNLCQSSLVPAQSPISNVAQTGTPAHTSSPFRASRR